MDKVMAYLTDGVEIYESRLVTQDELDELHEEAYQATDGNIFWVDMGPVDERANQASSALYQADMEFFF